MRRQVNRDNDAGLGPGYITPVYTTVDFIRGRVHPAVTVLFRVKYAMDNEKQTEEHNGNNGGWSRAAFHRRDVRVVHLSFVKQYFPFHT